MKRGLIVGPKQRLTCEENNLGFTFWSYKDFDIKASWIQALSAIILPKMSEGRFILTTISSVAQSCPTVCDPVNRGTPGLPVHYQLPEFTQTHIHRVGDAIQPSHPLASPSPPAPNPSQHQSLFQWVSTLAWGGQSTGVSALASFLPKNTQDWSPLEWTGWIFLQSKGFSRVFSNTTV